MMSRKLSAFCLAFAAVVAFSAFGAAGASAQTAGHLTTDGERFTLLGTERAGGTNALTMFGSELQCDSEYTGHKFERTPHEPLTNGDTKVTIEPDWTNCNGGTRHIDTRSCDLEIYDATTTGGIAGTYGVKLGIECAQEGDYILMDATSGCDTRFFEQAELTGLHLTDQGNGKLRLHGSVHSLTATTPNCFDLHTNEAVLHLDVDVEGLNEEGGTTEISISDEAA